MKTFKITCSPRSSQEEIFTIEFPEFTGTERQIEYAENIFSDIIGGLVNMVHGKMDNDKVVAQYNMIVGKLSSVIDATYWIENKNNNFQEIYKSL